MKRTVQALAAFFVLAGTGAWWMWNSLVVERGANRAVMKGRIISFVRQQKHWPANDVELVSKLKWDSGASLPRDQVLGDQGDSFMLLRVSKDGHRATYRLRTLGSVCEVELVTRMPM